MPDGYRLYRGVAYRDPRGFRIVPNVWWETDPLLEIKPWHPALFWQWLAKLAVWEPEGKNVARRRQTVHVERGQVYHTLRFIGERPGWSKNRVKEELLRLERDGRVELGLVAGRTMVTLLNYDPYQDIHWYLGTVDNPSRDKIRDRLRDNGNASARMELDRAVGLVRDSFRDRNRDRDRTGTGHNLNPPDSPPTPPFPSPSISPPLPTRARARPGQTSGPPRAARPTTSWRDLRAAKLAKIWGSVPRSARVPMLLEAVASGPPPDDLVTWARDQCELAGVPFVAAQEELGIGNEAEEALRRKIRLLGGRHEKQREG